MALITTRTNLSNLAAISASVRKAANERATQRAQEQRESPDVLSELQQLADKALNQAYRKTSDIVRSTRREGLVTSRTNLKSKKYSDFEQERKSEPPTNLKSFGNTSDIVDRHTTPDTKVGLPLQVEKRKEDVVRITKSLNPFNNPQAVKFQINQAFLNQSVALNLAARGKFREAGVSAGIGAARLLGVSASAIAQTAVVGLGVRLVQGFVPLNGGYLVKNKLAGPFASLIPGGDTDNSIAKGGLALLGKTINDGFVGSTNFNNYLLPADAKSLNEVTDQEGRTSQAFTTGSFQDSDDWKLAADTTNIKVQDNKTGGKKLQGGRKVLKDAKQGVPGTRAKLQPLDTRFYLKIEDKTGLFAKEIDPINYASVLTEELKDYTDIIPFVIQTIPAKGNPEYLYFRAYLDSFGDNFTGDWNGTRYIGRAEELYNYTGFQRNIQFSFKAAAHSRAELTPIYEKLNRLAGTTAPTYNNGVFMQGVFCRVTIGDYLQKVPGFFTGVNFTWQVNYPWEIEQYKEGIPKLAPPRVPHILDVSVTFQPIHDFAPQYDKNFFGVLNGITATGATTGVAVPAQATLEEITVVADQDE